MTLEIISWSISTKVWDRTGIELATPGSAVRHASVARHVTDCATRPGVFRVNLILFEPMILVRQLSAICDGVLNCDWGCKFKPRSWHRLSFRLLSPYSMPGWNLQLYGTMLWHLILVYIVKFTFTLTATFVSSIPARSHTFVEIDHEIISTVILLPSAESFEKGCCQLQGKVCARSTGYLLVQACPGKSAVRWTDRPAMTIAVDLGRKATKANKLTASLGQQDVSFREHFKNSLKCRFNISNWIIF